jgi:hypothetical protein
VTNPPPFVAEAPTPGDPTTVGMDGKGATDATAEEQGGGTPPASGADTPPASDGAATPPATPPSQ